MQKWEKNPKMGFYCWPNMALTNPWIRPNIWSHFERENRREKEEKREEEEEEEEEEKERSSRNQKGLELYGFVWISCLDICLWVVSCRKPNPRMKLCMEIITNPFVSLGFCYERT